MLWATASCGRESQIHYCFLRQEAQLYSTYKIYKDNCRKAYYNCCALHILVCCKRCVPEIVQKQAKCILGGLGRFWEGGVDFGTLGYSCRKKGIFWKERVYSGRESLYIKFCYILGGRGRLWECRIQLSKRGYPILGGSERFLEDHI